LAVVRILDRGHEVSQERIGDAYVQFVAEVDVCRVGAKPVIFGVQFDLVRLCAGHRVGVPNPLAGRGGELIAPTLEQVVGAERRLESVLPVIAA
jgi:hypothetical protein